MAHCWSTTLIKQRTCPRQRTNGTRSNDDFQYIRRYRYRDTAARQQQRYRYRYISVARVQTLWSQRRLRYRDSRVGRQADRCVYPRVEYWNLCSSLDWLIRQFVKVIAVATSWTRLYEQLPTHISSIERGTVECVCAHFSHTSMQIFIIRSLTVLFYKHTRTPAHILSGCCSRNLCVFLALIA